jgi:hypothetical protein
MMAVNTPASHMDLCMLTHMRYNHNKPCFFP